MEGTYQIATGSLVSLSEQQLIDCSVDEGNIGCGGGDVSYALQYVLDNKGLDSEDDYSYQSSDAVCWTEVNTKQTNKQTEHIYASAFSLTRSLSGISFFRRFSLALSACRKGAFLCSSTRPCSSYQRPWHTQPPFSTSTFSYR